MAAGRALFNKPRTAFARLEGYAVAVKAQPRAWRLEGVQSDEQWPS